MPTHYRIQCNLPIDQDYPDLASVAIALRYYKCKKYKVFEISDSTVPCNGQDGIFPLAPIKSDVTSKAKMMLKQINKIDNYE